MEGNGSKTAEMARVSLEGDTARVSGPLSFATVPSLLPSSGQWLKPGREQLMVDLSSVPWADSAGLALLLEWLAQAKARNIALHFSGIDRQVAEIIRVNGLQELLGLAPHP
jgi:phospholipid transport system transporter-binding protein